MLEDSYRRHLRPGERVYFATHPHPVVAAEPWGTAALVFMLVLAGSALAMRTDHAGVSWVLWLLWLPVVARAAWATAAFRTTWYVATDSRVVVVRGLLTRSVLSLNREKIVDLDYTRTLAGRLLGYGTFVLDTAGQERSLLQRLDHVPDPDARYQDLTAALFPGKAGSPPQGPPQPAPPPPAPAPWATSGSTWTPGPGSPPTSAPPPPDPDDSAGPIIIRRPRR